MNAPINKDEAEILAVTRQLTQWMVEKDTVAMRTITDESFSITHITGYVQPRQEWFAEIDRESMKYYSAKEVAHKIIIEGNKAVFMNQNLLDARIWDSRNTWRLQQNMQLEKQGGKWIILNSVVKIF